MRMRISSVFLKTLHDYRRMAFAWGFGIFLLVFMYVSFYPSIAQSPEIGTLFENLPEALQSIIGETSFYATPSGFINAEFFTLTAPILLSILAITIGSGLISKEEEGGTLDLLLARPISRSKLLSQKVLGLLVVTGGIASASWVAVAIGSLVINQFRLNLWHALLVVIAVTLLAWTFGFFALLVATIRGQRGLGIGVGTVVFIVSYVVHLFADSVEWIGSIRRLSLFSYYDSAQIFGGSVAIGHMLLFVALSAGLYLAAQAIFARRDVGA